MVTPRDEPAHRNSAARAVDAIAPIGNNEEGAGSDRRPPNSSPAAPGVPSRPQGVHGGWGGGGVEAGTGELAGRNEREAGGLQRACSLGVVDEIIEPSRTREAIARAIADAPQHRGSHGNIPL